MARPKKVVEAPKDAPETLSEHPFYGFTLDEDQRYFRDNIWDESVRIVFCNAKAGSGKAQPIDTLIPTPDGYRFLGDIRVGDYVFDRLGNPTKVLGVFPQGMQRAYKVTLSDNRSTICCSEHLWTYYRNNDGVAITETLESMLKRSILLGKERQGARYNIPTNGILKYKEKHLPVDPYIVGVFLGNGCCTGDPLYYSSDSDEIPKKIAEYLDAECVRNSEKNYTYHFKKDGHIIKCSDVFSELPELKNYSYNKSIPNDYLYCGVEQRFSLLQGLMDTDGGICVSYQRYNMQYSTTSKRLCDDFVTLCRSLGINATVHTDMRDKYTNGVVYDINLLCSNDIKEKCFRLKRKLDIAKEAKLTDKRRKYNQIAIRSVDDLGYECEMVCIYVDNPEHLYLTNDCIVTHNTTVAFATANLLYEYGKYDGIIYVVSPYGEGKQGFLPGDITEKSEVYFEPLYQAMIKCNIFPPKAIYNDSLASANKESTGYVKCLTHTYLRGTNFENKVVIIDEAQNVGFPDLKKILTRVNDDCKVVVIGHNLQKDIDDPKDSFVRYMDYFQSFNDPRVAVCKLTKNYRGWISQTADSLEL